MLRYAFLAGAASALVPSELAAIERRSGGRLGVYALDTGSGRTIAYRAHERFPLRGTFALLLAGAVLARVDGHNEDLGRRVGYGDADMLAGSPVSRAHLSRASMTIAELCAAVIEHGDNTAANLLLHSLLGPAGVTKFARKLGDSVTRLDRDEPALNDVKPGDPRDTTTPAAMAADARALLVGNALSPRSRARLNVWMKTSQSANAVGLIRPPQHAQIVFAACATPNAVPADVRRYIERTFG